MQVLDQIAGQADILIQFGVRQATIMILKDLLKQDKYTKAFDYICDLPKEQDCIWKRVNVKYIANMACEICVYRRENANFVDFCAILKEKKVNEVD
jgi:hypothetical protein